MSNAFFSFFDFFFVVVVVDDDVKVYPKFLFVKVFAVKFHNVRTVALLHDLDLHIKKKTKKQSKQTITK